MDRKAKIGVVGLGGRGLYLGYRCFANNPRSTLVASCDLDTKRLDDVRAKQPDVRTYDSLDEMLANPDVEAVVVATPDHAHAENAVAALNAGKHVFLEKPMAQTIEDCDAILDAWHRAQTTLLVGLELRYCSLCQEMRRLIDRGDIGEVKCGYAVDNVSVGGQYYFHGRRRKKDYIVSLMLEKGTHSLDLVNWYVGSEPVREYGEGGLDVFGGDESNDKRCRDCEKKDSCPYFIDHERFTMDYGVVIQTEDQCVWAQECEVEDNCIVTITYANGARMTYTECHFTPDYTREFTFIGTKGRLYGFYNNEQEFKIVVTYRHSDKVDEYFPPKIPGGHGGGDPRIQEEFLDRVLSGEPSMSGALDARNSAAIAIAAAESVETHKAVTIPAYSPSPPEPESRLSEPIGARTAVAVKLADIVDAIEMRFDDWSAYLNTKTGEIVHISSEAFAAAEEGEEVDPITGESDTVRHAIAIMETNDYLELPDQFEVHDYNVMEDFCLGLDDEKMRDEMCRAIKGKGAFRRFKDRLHQFGIAEEWYAYRSGEYRQAVQSWCEAHGIPHTG